VGTEINSVFLVYVLFVICEISSLMLIFTTDTDSVFAYHYFSETTNYIIPATVYFFIGAGLGSVWVYILKWEIASFFHLIQIGCVIGLGCYCY